jgi:hypothetical protein
MVERGAVCFGHFKVLGREEESRQTYNSSATSAPAKAKSRNCLFQVKWRGEAGLDAVSREILDPVRPPSVVPVKFCTILFERSVWRV